MTRKDIFKLDLLAQPEPLIYMSRFPVAKDLGKNITRNATAAEVGLLLEEEMQRWSKRVKMLNVLLAYERDDRKRYAEEKIAEEEERRRQLEKDRMNQEKKERAALPSQEPQKTGSPPGAAPPALPVNPVPSGAPPPSGFPSEAPSGGGNPPSSAGQPGAHPWQQTPYPFSQASGGYVCFAIYDFLSQH